MKDLLGKKLLEWRIRAALPYIRGRLLDIGCGTNQLVTAYQGKGIGVDIHPWDGVDQVVEDTANLPFTDGEFETVTIIAALNHIPNREAVLREAYRVLSTSGRIVITMIPPLISRIWHKIREPWDVDQSERGMKEGEVFGISNSDVLEMLEEAGFEPIGHTRFMLGLNHLNIARKKFPGQFAPEDK